MSTPSFSKEDFAKWNQTTSMFYLPKRLVGKSKVTSLRSELVKAIGESKVSVVCAGPAWIEISCLFCVFFLSLML